MNPLDHLQHSHKITFTLDRMNTNKDMLRIWHDEIGSIMFEGSTDDSLLELDLSVDHNHGMNFIKVNWLNCSLF